MGKFVVCIVIEFKGRSFKRVWKVNVVKRIRKFNKSKVFGMKLME